MGKKLYLSALTNPDFETCPICCRPASQPYRYGMPPVGGCVAACHDKHLQLSSDVAHARKVRKQIEKRVS